MHADSTARLGALNAGATKKPFLEDWAAQLAISPQDILSLAEAGAVLFTRAPAGGAVTSDVGSAMKAVLTATQSKTKEETRMTAMRKTGFPSRTQEPPFCSDLPVLVHVIIPSAIGWKSDLMSLCASPRVLLDAGEQMRLGAALAAVGSRQRDGGAGGLLLQRLHVPASGDCR
jgi:predicted secreted protein